MSNNHLNSSVFSGMELSPENCYFRANWDDPTDPFESALSSMVSSPTSNGGGLISGDGMMMRELIGRLGSICESGEISPQSCIATANNTPLNSPPKFNLSSLSRLNRDSKIDNYQNDPPSLAFFDSDPGFAERAAKFSSFGGELGISNRSGINSQLDGYFGGCQKNFRPENGDSREGSSVSEQNPGRTQSDVNSRKRKSIPKAKVKESSPPKIDKGEEENKEGSKTNGKRSKKDEEQGNNRKSKEKENKNSNSNSKNKDSEKTTEPLKDYIHVRARRGQATDSHSLAERVRREKISERMKFLQDLVPGCNKVTGKATVLDEIINYVQSLQGQVEFLSMKLATVNPRMDFNTEPLLCNDMFECRGSAQTMYPLHHNSAQAFPSGYQSSQHILPNFVNGTQNPFSLNPLNPTGIHRIPILQFPSIGGFSDPMTQIPGFWEDDLPSIIQMGIAQNQTQPGSGMKVEE